MNLERALALLIGILVFTSSCQETKQKEEKEGAGGAEHVVIHLEDGSTKEIEWDPAWSSLVELPPDPGINDCAKIPHPKGGWTCDQGGCTSSCGMYVLDLNNPAEWEEVDWPMNDPQANYVYFCRCK